MNVLMHRKTDCRQAILEAAERVVTEAGAAHLTLDAVAGKAGVSKGGLLYHFPSKKRWCKDDHAIVGTGGRG